ncbi:endonuclease V [Fibrella sp. WM1]|uniref:endonuclease V n=1 Tax=Fibrella musci TaxID=3242485 RepID=UPI003520FAD6
MILAVDAYYLDNTAKVVGILVKDWTDPTPYLTESTIIHGINDYEPGAFYKRELPCLIKFLEKIDLSLVTIIVIDGFIFLDDTNKKGLGAYLYDYLTCSIPVIGVAKSSFLSAETSAIKVWRRDSKNPLFVTAVGIELSQAAAHVRSMAGNYRIPTLLKTLDQETKNFSLT